MHVHTTRVQLLPSQGQEGMRRWREAMLPWLREQPGFRRAIVLDAPETHRGMALLFFASKAEWEAVAEAFVAQAGQHLRPIIDPDGQHLGEGFTLGFDEE
jgi:hypothetical protein